MESTYIHGMKKSIFIVAGLTFIGISLLSSCAKMKADPFDSFVGDFKGTLVDSDLVTHHITTHTAYPINMVKLTSSRVGLGSDSAGITDFYADVTITGSDMTGTIPGQTADTITLQGIASSRLGLPAGTTLAYTGSDSLLVFAYRMGYTTMSGGRVVIFQGRRQ